MALRAALVAMLLSMVTPTRSEACAAVDHDPNSLATRVRGEEAIIVFDAATNTEHFIRSAAFVTRGTDLGFIVPTPSVPTFGEVDQAVFGELARSAEAARPEQLELSLSSLLVLSRRDVARAASVLSTSRVAGMDVTVLRATEAAGLEDWLTKHGFVMRPALQAWLKTFIDRGYVFSAFRYPAEGSQVTTKAVRISFETKVPVYPYLEPADALPRSEPLRVWLVAPERRAWVDEQPAPLPVRELASTTKLTVPASLAALAPASSWVTLFIDERRTRPAGDVRFEVSADQLEVPPAPKVRTVGVPVEGLLLLFGVGAAVLVGFRRRRGP